MTFERVDSLLSYNPETGVLRWKVSPARNVKAGSEVGCLANGYIQVRIDGELYQAHRVAHLLVTGHWPEGNPEHENRIKSDNRWENIKDLARNQSENMANVGVPVNNTSGLKGVTRDRNRDKWMRLEERTSI